MTDTTGTEGRTWPKLTRGEARAKIFASKQRKTEIIEFQDVMLELRQPLLGDILKAQGSENREAAVIETLVNYAYLPGTDEKVFEDTDKEGLLAMPFGADFIRVSQALERLTEVNFLDKKPS